MQARREHAAAAALATQMQNEGYGSDDEVYATADAVDGANATDYDELVSQGDKKSVEPLPALDHGNIEYDDFGKDFYEEKAEIAAMTPAEVGSTLALRAQGRPCVKHSLGPSQSFGNLSSRDVTAWWILRFGHASLRQCVAQRVCSNGFPGFQLCAPAVPCIT